MKQTTKTNLLVSGVHFGPGANSNHHKKEIPVMASPPGQDYCQPRLTIALGRDHHGFRIGTNDESNEIDQLLK
jgi:hypothetical protein